MPIASRQSAFLPLLIAGLATIGPFSIDTYLPSFPAMSDALGTTPLHVQQTLTAYLLPYAGMMLFHGAVSDAFGRRRPILAGIAGYTIASVGCALSAGIGMLLFFRALQGLLAGVGMVLGRAIIRDCYHGHEAQRLMSRVLMIFALAPAVAPVIGGWLQAWFGWRANFWFLGGLGLTLFLACLRFLPETHPPHARSRFAPAPLIAAYRHVAPQIQRGMKPSDIGDLMKAAHESLGAQHEFALILLGEASAYPHGSGKPQAVRDGEVVLMDCGCSVEGYQSDISRTFVFGEASAEQRKVWKQMREGQRIAIETA